VAPPNVRFSLVRSVAVLKPLLGMGTYLSLMLRSPILQHQINEKKTQTAQSNIFQAKIRSLVFPIPSLKEQTEIIRRVEILLQFADLVEERVKTAMLRSDKLTQSILAKVFRGELVPTEAELARREGRDYEPASVLLERIKKKRETTASGRNFKTKQSGKARLANRKALISKFVTN
jgi:type I restriction enzyme, S subunit